ncbi:hypothetical protein LEMLEM_LOCUS20632 [Lemmus lemmus]
MVTEGTCRLWKTQLKKGAVRVKCEDRNKNGGVMMAVRCRSHPLSSSTCLAEFRAHCVGSHCILPTEWLILSA